MFQSSGRGPDTVQPKIVEMTVSLSSTLNFFPPSPQNRGRSLVPMIRSIAPPKSGSASSSPLSRVCSATFDLSGGGVEGGNVK